MKKRKNDAQGQCLREQKSICEGDSPPCNRYSPLTLELDDVADKEWQNDTESLVEPLVEDNHFDATFIDDMSLIERVNEVIKDAESILHDSMLMEDDGFEDVKSISHPVTIAVANEYLDPSNDLLWL